MGHRRRFGLLRSSCHAMAICTTPMIAMSPITPAMNHANMTFASMLSIIVPRKPEGLMESNSEFGADFDAQLDAVCAELIKVAACA